MTHEVYISYDDEDKLAADAIVHALEENRIDVTSSVQKEMTTWEEDASAWLSNIH